MHRHDCALMCQITHMGRRTCDDVADWLPTSPQPGARAQHRSFPKAIELTRSSACSRAMPRGRGAAGGRARRGRGDRLGAIWSTSSSRPRSTGAADAYGGSTNRCRFALEVFGAIREAVGPDYVVGIRMTGDEHVRDGRDPESARRSRGILAGSGLIDFFNVVAGTLGTDASVAYTIPSMGNRYGPFLELAGRIRRATGLPVFQASRIPDLSTARWAVEQGFVDMVGMTRAHIADPHIVAKLQRGEEHRIRPCVGMGYCIDRIYQGKDALCIHNPATGREATMPHVVQPSDGPRRKVVVVGGGVGGMEAARVRPARPRGHPARGHRPAGRPDQPRRQGAGPRGDRRHRRLARRRARAGGRRGAAQQLRRGRGRGGVEPDVVIVATGGVPDTSFLEAGEDLVTSVWDVLGGYVEPAGSVLLYDDHGWHQGPSTAVALAGKGLALEVVTPDRMLAFEVGATNFPNYLRELYRHGVKLTPDLELRSVAARGNRLVASFWNEYAEEEVERVVDQVVVEHGTLPADELYHALKDGSRNGGAVDVDGLVTGTPGDRQQPRRRYLLYRVGDAVSSRNVHAAIYDCAPALQGPLGCRSR